mmetsp:Transcript_85733/g.195441  ORF Transcript_85733/g.195441 Transcript_85733/m.195441 type:complete len:205 (-) Transcript_85733:1108-1722(-)
MILSNRFSKSIAGSTASWRSHGRICRSQSMSAHSRQLSSARCSSKAWFTSSNTGATSRRCFAKSTAVQVPSTCAVCLTSLCTNAYPWWRLAVHVTARVRRTKQHSRIMMLRTTLSCAFKTNSPQGFRLCKRSIQNITRDWVDVVSSRILSSTSSTSRHASTSACARPCLPLCMNAAPVSTRSRRRSCNGPAVIQRSPASRPSEG